LRDSGRKASIRIILGSMNKVARIFALSAAVLILTILASASPIPGLAQSSGARLSLSGAPAYFFGPGKPLNCTLNNRYKKGDPVGFRMTAINAATGKRDRATQLVIHLTYGGKTNALTSRVRE